MRERSAPLYAHLRYLKQGFLVLSLLDVVHTELKKVIVLRCHLLPSRRKETRSLSTAVGPDERQLELTPKANKFSGGRNRGPLFSGGGEG
jgi:hypothetical protein